MLNTYNCSITLNAPNFESPFLKNIPYFLLHFSLKLSSYVLYTIKLRTSLDTILSYLKYSDSNYFKLTPPPPHVGSNPQKYSKTPIYNYHHPQKFPNYIQLACLWFIQFYQQLCLFPFFTDWKLGGNWCIKYLWREKVFLKRRKYNIVELFSWITVDLNAMVSGKPFNSPPSKCLDPSLITGEFQGDSSKCRRTLVWNKKNGNFPFIAINVHTNVCILRFFKFCKKI